MWQELHRLKTLLETSKEPVKQTLFRRSILKVVCALYILKLTSSNATSLYIQVKEDLKYSYLAVRMISMEWNALEQSF